MIEMIGQLIGFVATGLFFLSYQIFDKKKLLLMQTAATATLCLHYILVDAYSGFGLNIVCIVRNVLFYHRDKKPFSGVWLPISLAALMGAISLFSWDGYYSLLIIGGLMINTVCMGLCNSQNLRKSILVTCPMVLLYDWFAGSYGGMISEAISLISAVIGIVRYKKSLL